MYLYMYQVTIATIWHNDNNNISIYKDLQNNSYGLKLVDNCQRFAPHLKFWSQFYSTYW